MNDVNMASSTASNITTNTYYGSCPYRLPCGYCKEMMSPCFYSGFEINKITCVTGGSINANGKETIEVTCKDNSRETIEVNYKDNNAVNIINKAENVTL